MEVTSLCTFALGQETGLESAVRGISSNPSTLCFVVGQGSKKGLPLHHVRTGPLVIMYDSLQNSRNLL